MLLEQLHCLKHLLSPAEAMRESCLSTLPAYKVRFETYRHKMKGCKEEISDHLLL